MIFSDSQISDEKLEWHVLNSKILLKTCVFNVTENESCGPDGHIGKFIVNDAKDWIIVIPEINGNFLLEKQWRHGEQKLSIEFPGGVIEENETPSEAAERELLEETGYRAGTLIHLGTANPNPALFSNNVHFFYATRLEKVSDQKLDNDEFLEYFEMEKEKLFNLLTDSKICHALMLSAVSLYLLKIQNAGK